MEGKPPGRLDKAERALKQLIDYAMTINKIAIEKGLWTMEEFNRAHLDMESDRRVLADIGHDSGMRVINLASLLSKFKPKAPSPE